VRTVAVKKVSKKYVLNSYYQKGFRCKNNISAF
jgi:hypothetical protein